MNVKKVKSQKSLKKALENRPKTWLNYGGIVRILPLQYPRPRIDEGIIETLVSVFKCLINDNLLYCFLITLFMIFLLKTD